MTNTFEANIFKQNTYLHTNLSYLKAYYVMMIILALLTSADNSGDVCVCFLLRRNHSVLKDLLLNLLQFSLMLFPPILEIFLIATQTHSFSSSLFLLKLFFFTLQQLFLCINILVNIPLTQSRTSFLNYYKINR